MSPRFASLCGFVLLSLTALRAAELRSESFDTDPHWEGFNNHIVPKSGAVVRQDFGFSPTHFAGQAEGELGGRVQRSTTPASYAAKIPSRTLDDPLDASGSFAVTATTAGAGVFFGFFNSRQPGGSGRAVGSLGLDFDFEKRGGRLAVRLITDGNQSCGTFITPFVPGPAVGRPTPIRNDGTRYRWNLHYDPKANQGSGRFQFSVQSEGAARDEFEGKTFSVNVPPEVRKEGATFDRFGLHNMMKAGGSVSIYFDDLQFDGRSENFEQDPGWEGSGNRLTFEDREQVGAHDFGYSEKTSHAGGQAGEVGGSFWRSGLYGYYADKVGPLSLEDRLEARGRVVLVVGGPDSDMAFGWFNSATREVPPTTAGNFVGVKVGGPTRVGHYFLPGLVTSQGTVGKVGRGPILKQGQSYEWSLVYDPAAHQGLGQIEVTLGGETVKLELKPGQKAEGATFDRFGLFTETAGGQMVKLYLDDLRYSSSRP